MNSTGVAHRRGFAIVVLLAAVALAAYLLHARLGDTARDLNGTSAPAGAAPVAQAASESAAPGGDGYGTGDGYGAAAPANNGANNNAANNNAANNAAAAGKVTTSLTAKKLPRMGNAVVDQEGYILYRFDPDKKNPQTSTCVDKCAEAWPPSLQGDTPPKLTGIDPAAVTTIARPDGSKQLAIDGWLMYRYAKEPAAGKWAGQGVNNVWWVIAPNGARNTSCAPPGAVIPNA